MKSCRLFLLVSVNNPIPLLVLGPPKLQFPRDQPVKLVYTSVLGLQLSSWARISDFSLRSCPYSIAPLTKLGSLLPCLLTPPSLQHSCGVFMRLPVMFCALVLLLSCPITRGELSWFKGGVAAFMEFLLTYRKMSLNGINFLLLNAVKKNIREISSALVYYIINKVIIKISTVTLQSYLNYHSYLLYLAWE